MPHQVNPRNPCCIFVTICAQNSIILHAVTVLPFGHCWYGYWDCSKPTNGGAARSDSGAPVRSSDERPNLPPEGRFGRSSEDRTGAPESDRAAPPFVGFEQSQYPYQRWPKSKSV